MQFKMHIFPEDLKLKEDFFPPLFFFLLAEFC